MQKDIVFIINSFNRFVLLKQCLGVIASWLPLSALSTRCAFVIYDAGSTDGSVEWINTESAQLQLDIRLLQAVRGENNSFSVGVNTASAYAINTYPALQYLLFYETDNQILLETPILQALYELETKKNLAACGFTVRRHNHASAGIGAPFPRLFNFAVGKKVVHKFQLEAIPFKWEQDKEGISFSKVDVVFSSPLLVKKDPWMKSGGFDAVLFPFSECDTDWAKRLFKKGWQLGVIKTSEVIHDNLSEISLWSKKRAINSHRGKLNYFKRHHPISVYLVWPVLLMIRHSMEYVAVKLFIKDKAKAKHLSEQSVTLLKTCLKGYNQIS